MARLLSEMVRQCSGLARGSTSPTFIPSSTGVPRFDETSQHTVDIGSDLTIVHGGHDLTLFDNGSYFPDVNDVSLFR